jgi:hypothetical protein
MVNINDVSEELTGDPVPGVNRADTAAENAPGQ